MSVGISFAMRYTSYFVPGFNASPLTENACFTPASTRYVLSATSGVCPSAPVAANISAGVGALDPWGIITIHTPDFALLMMTSTVKLVCVMLTLVGVPAVNVGASTVVTESGDETAETS